MSDIFEPFDNDENDVLKHSIERDNVDQKDIDKNVTVKLLHFKKIVVTAACAVIVIILAAVLGHIEESRIQNYGYEAEEDDVTKVNKYVPEVTVAEHDENDYQSPVDFKPLNEQNQDVIGWLSIPGTNVSYPVYQNPEIDTFYLDHNADKNEDINGALFTEMTYNRDDFSDPVTVIYGHNMKSGNMFGYLQESFETGFEGHNEALVYMPDKAIRYKLFAAMPIGSGHLLHGRNLYDSEVFSGFADEIINYDGPGMIKDDSVQVDPGDKLLIMSTCIGGDADSRYIVVGKKTEDIVSASQLGEEAEKEATAEEESGIDKDSTTAETKKMYTADNKEKPEQVQETIQAQKTIQQASAEIETPEYTYSNDKKYTGIKGYSSGIGKGNFKSPKTGD